HQVVRPQDRRPGRVVHGRRRVVVRVTDADDVGVGEVLPHHGVGEGPGRRAAADPHELPLLVGAAPAAVLHDVAAVGGGGTLDLKGLAAVAIDGRDVPVG